MGDETRPEPSDRYPPRLMRAQRAARYLGISESTFRRAVRDGQLPPPVRGPGFIAWDRHDLDAAVENFKDDNVNTVDRQLQKLARPKNVTR